MVVVVLGAIQLVDRVGSRIELSAVRRFAAEAAVKAPDHRAAGRLSGPVALALDILRAPELGRRRRDALAAAIGTQPAVDDGRLPLDHNAVESALRVVCLGETGRLFAGSTEAAKRLAAILTVIATARAHGLNVMDYLTHVFTALPERGKDDSVAHLLPAAAKAA